MRWCLMNNRLLFWLRVYPLREHDRRVIKPALLMQQFSMIRRSRAWCGRQQHMSRHWPGEYCNASPALLCCPDNSWVMRAITFNNSSFFSVDFSGLSVYSTFCPLVPFTSWRRWFVSCALCSVTQYFRTCLGSMYDPEFLGLSMYMGIHSRSY